MVDRWSGIREPPIEDELTSHRRSSVSLMILSGSYKGFVLFRYVTAEEEHQS